MAALGVGNSDSCHLQQKDLLEFSGKKKLSLKVETLLAIEETLVESFL